MGRFLIVAGALATVLTLGPGPAEARYSGHNFRGDYGIQSASQPEPGFYVPVVYLRYDAEASDNLGLDLGEVGDILGKLIGKNRVYGAGPEVTVRCPGRQGVRDTTDGGAGCWNRR